MTISATSVSEHFDDPKPTSFTDVTRLLSHEPIYPKGSPSVRNEEVHVCEGEEGVEMPIVSCTGLRPDEEGRHAELGGPWPWFGQ